MSKPKDISIHQEKQDPQSLKLTLFSFHLFCLLFLPTCDSPALTGPSGDFRCPYDLFSGPSFPSERDQLCDQDHVHYSGFFFRETSGLSEVSTISLFDCCINPLTNLPISSLTFLPICSPFYRQSVTLKCKSNHAIPARQLSAILYCLSREKRA